MAADRRRAPLLVSDDERGDEGDSWREEQAVSRWPRRFRLVGRVGLFFALAAALALIGARARYERARPRTVTLPVLGSRPRGSYRGGGSRSASSDEDYIEPLKPKSIGKHRELPHDPVYGPPGERPYSRPLEPRPDVAQPSMRKQPNASAACGESESYRLPTDVIPIAYNLTIELSSLKGLSYVYGRVSIELQRNRSAAAPRCLVFHVAPEVQIDALALGLPDENDRLVDARIANYDAEWSQMHVRLGEELQGRAVLTMHFGYVLHDKLTGLYHSRFVGVDGKEHSIATTQHEATSARETFPCWDEPGMKATFQITLHVPDANATVALSNMPPLSQRRLHQGLDDESLRRGRGSLEHAAVPLRRVEFDRSPRMSTYLVAFTVGELESISQTTESGVEIRAWAPAATQQVAKLRYALRVAVEALDYYEGLFEIPFPLPQIDIVSIPDFGPGAMENWGLITYRATSILADELSSPADRQSVACTVVHELGHQWTGNLVTMGWWDELWLNEGFANFFEQAVTSQIEPDLSIGKQHVQYLSQALHFDGSPDTHAVRPVRAVASDSAIGALFDSISYDKAGAVIFMLHDYLERRLPGTFVRGLKSYLEKHQFGTASGSDMWEHFTLATGLPISAMIEPWFSQAGYPLIEVTTLSDGSAVLLQTGRYMQDLTQTQIAFKGQAGGDQAEYTDSWWVPISYYTSTSREVHVGEIDSTSAFFSIPPAAKRDGGFDISGSDWLKVNYNGAGYYRVNYAPHLWARLVQAATQPESASGLSDADLANLIDDAFALTLNGRLSGVTLSLARALGMRTAHESAFATLSYESWQALSIGLHGFLGLLAGTSQATSSQTGLIAGPGLELIPRRCVDDLQRFVRTQALGRSLDRLLAVPPTGVLRKRGADEGEELERAQERTPRDQLEALAAPVMLSLASAMGDVRVGMWAQHALQPCIADPEARCVQIDEIPPDLQSPCLSICAAFDSSGGCWRLMLGQLLRFADNDPAYHYSLISALAHAPTEELLNATIGLMMNQTVVRSQDVDAMLAMLAANSKLGRARQIVWDFAKANVEALTLAGGGTGSFSYASVLQNVAGGFASEEMAQDVQIFLALNPGLDLPERIVRAVVGKIRSQTIWVQNYGADTCTVLQSWHA